MWDIDGKREKSIIAILITFILALVLVYIIFVRVQGARHDAGSSKTESWSQFSSQEFHPDDESYSWNIDLGGQVDADELFASEIAQLSSSGVKLWYSDVPVLQKLSMSYETSFADKDDILYAYLGTSLPQDLKTIVRAFDGEILAIETRNDILGNHLWWDRILFINMPDTTFDQATGQRLLVAMIVTMGEDNRFIQAPIDKYYAHKNDMKSYFESIYDTTR